MFINKKITQQVKVYLPVILFFLSMFASNIVWKLIFTGDECSDTIVAFNKYDATPIFNKVTHSESRLAYNVIKVFDEEIRFRSPNILYFTTSNSSVRIVWSCSGIKQMFIFLCIMLLAPGCRTKKLWFIPLGLMLCYAINMVRIVIIVFIIKNNRDLFDIFHSHILKYLFYALIFAIWVVWIELINKKYLKK